jgi:hypothetical protein
VIARKRIAISIECVFGKSPFVKSGTDKPSNTNEKWN